MNFWGKWLRVICLLACLWLLLPARVEGGIQKEQEEGIPAAKREQEGVVTGEETEEELLEDLDLDEVQKTVDRLLEDDLSLTDMIRRMMDGELPFEQETFRKMAEKLLWDAAGLQKSTCAYILLLVLLSSVLANLSRVFGDQQISEIAFYMVYLLLFVILLKTFGTFAEEIRTALSGIVEFMRGLLPAYYLAITAATGIRTATVFYHMIILVIFLAESLILLALLPGIYVYLLMELVNHLTREEFLSQMARLLKSAITWSLKTIIGLLVGLQLIQRLISPAVDALKRTALGRTAGAIPGIGNMINGVTEMVLGSAVLVKNSLGAAAAVILLLLGISPLIRLGISAVFYQFLAALVQPVADRRMVGCLHTMGESIGLLLKLLLTVEVLFLLTIAILAGSLG
ncbi:MAG TPA: stage III sporulation protein AE [Candidatus Pullilachnospira intestinigallinarum]|nr:stage III sporulation protein AE [Candidatus Pullilachnospira intestinigallinarum]